MEVKIFEWFKAYSVKCLVCNKKAIYCIKVENKYISNFSCKKHVNIILDIIKNEYKKYNL